MILSAQEKDDPGAALRCLSFINGKLAKPLVTNGVDGSYAY